jgi:branched-subunit amino acid transport protein AzlD
MTNSCSAQAATMAAMLVVLVLIVVTLLARQNPFLVLVLATGTTPALPCC